MAFLPALYSLLYLYRSCALDIDAYDNWVKSDETLPINIFSAAIASYAGNIYMLGGRGNGNNVFDQQLLIIDLMNDTFIARNPYLTRSVYGDGKFYTQIDSKLYMLKTYPTYQSIDKIYRFNLQTLEFESSISVPTIQTYLNPSLGHFVEGNSSYLVIITRSNTIVFINVQTEEFSQTNTQWGAIGRHNSTCTIHGQTMFVVGGVHDSHPNYISAVVALNISSNLTVMNQATLQRLGNMSMALIFTRAIIHKDNILIIGGLNQSGEHPQFMAVIDTIDMTVYTSNSMFSYGMDRDASIIFDGLAFSFGGSAKGVFGNEKALNTFQIMVLPTPAPTNAPTVYPTNAPTITPAYVEFANVQYFIISILMVVIISIIFLKTFDGLCCKKNKISFVVKMSALAQMLCFLLSYLFWTLQALTENEYFYVLELEFYAMAWILFYFYMLHKLYFTFKDSTYRMGKCFILFHLLIIVFIPSFYLAITISNKVADYHLFGLSVIFIGLFTLMIAFNQKLFYIYETDYSVASSNKILSVLTKHTLLGSINIFIGVILIFAIFFLESHIDGPPDAIWICYEYAVGIIIIVNLLCVYFGFSVSEKAYFSICRCCHYRLEFCCKICARRKKRQQKRFLTHSDTQILSRNAKSIKYRLESTGALEDDVIRVN